MKRLLLPLLFAALTFSTASAATNRPNFIILISDDVSHDDLGCYGSLSARTPAIDSLAASGLRFNQAYLLASSCSPSRSSIISGRYPHNLGQAAELHRPISGHLPSIAGLLRDAGYHTALAGKNHLSWTPVPEGTTKPTPAFVKIYDAKVDGNSGGHGNWIKALEECPSGSPFFLWLAALDAHRSWDGDEEWDAARFGPKHDPATVILPPALADTPATRADFASYLNEITRFDHFVGRVVEWLKQKGQFENTYVFVLADNGRSFPRAKTRLHDDGMKTHLIVNGPGMTAKGRASDSLVSVIDIAPTVAEFAGIKKSATFQGRSLAGVLKDPAATVRPLAFSEHNWHDYEAHGRAVRDGRFLFIRNFRPKLAWQGPADSVRSPSHQALRKARAESQTLPPIQQDVFLAPRPEAELYDTRADPHQISNLAGKPEFAAIEKRLSAALERWMDQTGDSVPDQISPDMFNRETGAPLPGRRADTYLAPAGASRGADRINADGL
ncbi:MAG: sulfatase [Opitutaceae bacterium]|nr:sulfatase [Opitutaceae bacterium]